MKEFKKPERKTDKISIPLEETKLPEGAELLDGAGVEDFAEAPHYYTLQSGDLAIAGTDKGVNYKDHNEDVIVISPNENFTAVLDGVGGGGKGGIAAEALGQALLEAPDDVRFAVQKGISKMAEKGLLVDETVFISVRLLGNTKFGKYLEIFQSGDAKLIVIRKNGRINFESKDDSLVQILLDSGAITADAALYHPHRNVISKSVSLDRPNDEPKTYPKIAVEPGDFVLLMSDGISDNFTAGEIALKVKEGLSTKELFFWLAETSGQRMKNFEAIEEVSHRKTDGVYSDGYKSKPKPDNRALAIIEIK